MNAKLTLMVALCLLGSLWAPRQAQAHGIWGHVHVTAWAIENLPPGELRDFFDDPEVKNAALFGAAFTDSGYFPQAGDLSRRTRAYSEHTHWEPFVARYVAWMQANDPPPWTSRESRLRAAFLMGCASHGLQDEIFDSLFLHQTREHDDRGQDEADPGTDGFLALDGHIRLIPEPWLPMDVLLELYAELDAGITQEDIEQGVNLMTVLYLNDGGGLSVARGNGQLYGEEIPWTRAHYLDPAIPGSLRAEIVPTGRYLQAVWDRLHDRFDAPHPAIFAYPEAPRPLLGHQAASPDSWVTVILGVGTRYGSMEAGWQDEQEQEVPFATANTRWGESWTRLVHLRPQEDLSPGAWYTAWLAQGAERIDGLPVTQAWSHHFQVACTPESPEGTCEDLGELPLPDIDGPQQPDMGMEPEPDLSQEDAADMNAEPEPDLRQEDMHSADAAPDLPDQEDPGGQQADAAQESPRKAQGSGCQSAVDHRSTASWSSWTGFLLRRP